MSKESFPAKPIKKQTLAERVAEDIADLILGGHLAAGSVLPSEAELSKQYAVSQSVIRNATHLLVAQGLLDARHGKGVYVTSSQREAFGNALLLSLRRAGATTWDLEEFEQLLFPAVAAMASMNATDEELQRMRHAAFSYIDDLQTRVGEHEDVAAVEGPFTHILSMVYRLTHNEVVRQIGEQLVALRRSRQWSGIDEKGSLEMDKRFLEHFLAALETRDREYVKEQTEELMKLPAVAIDAMKNTPIGQVPTIDASLLDRNWREKASRFSDA